MVPVFFQVHHHKKGLSQQYQKLIFHNVQNCRTVFSQAFARALDPYRESVLVQLDCSINAI